MSGGESEAGYRSCEDVIVQDMHWILCRSKALSSTISSHCLSCSGIVQKLELCASLETLYFLNCFSEPQKCPQKQLMRQSIVTPQIEFVLCVVKILLIYHWFISLPSGSAMRNVYISLTSSHCKILETSQKVTYQGWVNCQLKNCARKRLKEKKRKTL